MKPSPIAAGTDIVTTLAAMHLAGIESMTLRILGAIATVVVGPFVRTVVYDIVWLELRAWYRRRSRPVVPPEK